MKKEDNEVICPSCSKPAEWIPNEQVYGRRYGKSYMCYYCRACDYMVGVHNNTRQPLGTMVGKELRNLRKQVHNKIDPLWKDGKIKRGHLYARISKALGYTYHTGETDAETCRKVLSLDEEYLAGKTKELDFDPSH